MMKVPIILCLIACLPAGSDAAITRRENDQSWDFLILAQFWPGTSCIYFGEEGCLVPPKLKGWTIHGLWPSSNQGPDPEDCNKSMPFNYTDIKPLRQQLDEQWPYLNKSGDRLALWSHEWSKHGTCAYDFPLLQGELKYFGTTLQLHSKLDIAGALSSGHINPSKKKQYDLSEIFLAVVDKYNKNPIITCFCSNEKYYLEQVYQCYDKTLTLIDCPEQSQYNYKNYMNKIKCQRKSNLSLHFESMKLKPDDSKPSSPNGYFVDCPDNDKVYYPLIPARKAVMETNEVFN